MSIQDLYAQYPEKTWVLVKVLKENDKNEVEDVELIFASQDRDEVYKKIADVPEGTHVATLYTGPIMEEGRAFAF